MKILLAIAAGLYSFVLRVRHLLYDSKIIGRYRADIPVVCVGNITVGGTGKTPVTEFLTEQLSRKYTVAILSRGYGRKTKGYIEVETGASYRTVGDEPKQLKRRFPDTVVVVCEKRAEGIRRIRKEHPEVNLILLDDGFQHRRVEPKVNIVLVDYTRPVMEDHMLPLGRLRDLPSQMSRANIVLVTKTPVDMTPIDRRLTVKSLKLFPYQDVFLTSMEEGEPEPLFPDVPGLVAPSRNIAVLAAIGNPKAMIDSLRKRYNVMTSWLYRDHHAYRVRDMKKIERLVGGLPPDTVIVTTDKDAVKLTSRSRIPVALQRRLYKIPVRIRFDEGYREKFLARLDEDINCEED